MDIIFCYVCVIILFLFNGYVVVSRPTTQILTYVNEQTKDGYHFRYDTDEGVFREETGKLVTKGNKEVLVVNGQYTYIGTDRLNYKVTYQADENGYRANCTRNTAQVLVPHVQSIVLASLAGGGIG